MSENDNISARVQAQARAAGRAASILARADGATRQAALMAVADAIDGNVGALAEQNHRDLELARDRDLPAALVDRLELTPARIHGMASGVRQVAGLDDPIGEVSGLRQQASGLRVGQMRVPLGVIGIIYESRPNVTADAAALCLKAGNATVLRGGSEAHHSNVAIGSLVQSGLKAAGLPADAVQLIETTDRAAVGALLEQDGLIDVIIPRGGKGLIERVARETRIPVLKHLDGVCHVYIDSAADPDMACRIAIDAKTYRYGICGAMETLLIHKACAAEILPGLAQDFAELGVALRGCARSQALVPAMEQATDEDWAAEYLSAILAVRVVDDLDDAIDHIDVWGSHHTDAIVSNDHAKIDRFVREVDSASVLVNAPTCFADGYEYGLGAEIGISTGKLHARGPVGVIGLTTQKFVVYGNGQTRGG